MSLRHPWFLVMAPKAAARFDGRHAGNKAVPCSDVLGSLMASANQRQLTVFGGVWLVAVLAIWLCGFGTRMFSLAFTIVATLLITFIVVASFVRLVCVQLMKRSPPNGQCDRYGDSACRGW
jgi:uncharacterized membrane protein